MIINIKEFRATSLLETLSNLEKQYSCDPYEATSTGYGVAMATVSGLCSQILEDVGKTEFAQNIYDSADDFIERLICEIEESTSESNSTVSSIFAVSDEHLNDYIENTARRVLSPIRPYSDESYNLRDSLIDYRNDENHCSDYYSTLIGCLFELERQLNYKFSNDWLDRIKACWESTIHTPEI